ncbi:pirin family protein [Mucilaginibacter celer]|uniref:Pirin family protein n=1 Tax=Mucilaginibacter celer TaxID=2305508 RepID=A0A494VJZ4_9SPHI|nr:pirin family protein [Mucilaginibacter celer]AYL95417.1 pirin family protein [Mucilaginibacter celer]
MKKAITHILAGREKKITAEETVRQPLPHKDFRFANPFIVLHHMGPQVIEPGQTLRIHPHPHRGFSPYTIMLQGEGYHKDNAGNDKIIKAGGVQWMFAGKGIMHSEGPTEQLLKNGGVMELIQLWINAPAAKKWDEPFYQAATADELPIVLQGDGLDFKLASGNYEDQTGPIENFSPVISIVGTVAAGKQVDFKAEPGYWTLLYIIRGSVIVNDEAVSQYNLIVFDKENEDITVIAAEDSQVLFLSAEPIEEPVAAKDNFVMNTAEEVDQAIADYHNGVFGTLNY